MRCRRPAGGTQTYFDCDFAQEVLCAPHRLHCRTFVTVADKERDRPREFRIERARHHICLVTVICVLGKGNKLVNQGCSRRL
jgi:hypothetical protein